MPNYPIEHVPDVDVVALPSKKIKTLDGVQIEYGMKLYCKFTPERCVEYEVLLEVGLLDPTTKQWHIVVLTPRKQVMVLSLPASQFVADPAKWEEFQAKRGGLPRGPSNSEAADNGSGASAPKRRRSKGVGRRSGSARSDD